MSKNNPENIVKAGLCTGCGACVFVAPDKIAMKMSEDGFLRPIVSATLSRGELDGVGEVCPGISLVHEKKVAAVSHPIWGPIKQANTGFSNSKRIRYQGSSGGVISALLVYLLETKKVDYVIHTIASTEDPLNNVTVISSDIDVVINGAGSRYAPSSPVATLVEAMNRPGRYAFVGKPCDVAAVRKILNRHPELKSKIPYLLSFMCAGTPSRKATEKIIDKFNFTGLPLKSFKYRGQGWPGMTMAETMDGQTAEMDYNSSWGEILNKQLQTRCKICPDGTGEFADVVGADAWYGKDGYPDFTEREGRSLILARTELGVELVSQAVSEGYLSIEDFSLDDLPLIQPYQIHRKQSIFIRLFALVVNFRRIPKYKNMHLLVAARMFGLKKNLRAFSGTFLRIIGGRL